MGAGIGSNNPYRNNPYNMPMNPNMGMNYMPMNPYMNNIQMNQNLILMKMMTNLYLSFQNMVRQRVQNNKNNFGIQGGNNYTYASPPTKLPTNQNITYAPPFLSNSPKMNIIFESSANYKMNMVVPIDIKMKDVFKAFVAKAGLTEDVLGKFINFLYNGSIININEEKTISQIVLNNFFCTFLVLDTSNLLAGKKMQK